MAEIVIKLPNEAAKEQAEKHARELGYEGADDLAFELLRNYTATREDQLYTRCHIGEHNVTFGRSRREHADHERRLTAEREERAEAEKKAKAKADAAQAAASDRAADKPNR